MSGFDVDEHALHAYAQLLNRYAGHATDLRKYVVNGDGPKVGVAFTPYTGATDVFVVYRELAKVHFMHMMRATERLKAMADVAEADAENLDDAAHYYETTDDKRAAAFDRQLAGSEDRDYPTGGGSEIRKDEPLEVYRKFEDPNDPAEVRREYERTAPSPEEFYEARQEALVTDTERWLNMIGFGPLVRAAVAELLGFDPGNVIARYLGGDWHAWHRATCMWEAVGGAVRAMGHNAGRREQLEWYWHGVAADTAQTHFSLFEEATHTEGNDYYDAYLVKFYREMTTMLIDVYDTVNNLVTALVDLVVGIGLAKLVQLAASGKAKQAINLIIDTWDMITSRMSDFQEATKQRSVAHLGDEPPCDMEKLKQYVHPAHAR